MPSTGMTSRTSWTMRCGVSGKRDSCARSNVRLRMPSRKGANAAAFGSLPSTCSGEPRETQAEVTHHFGMREEHLFDVCRRITHVNDLGSFRPHDERRLFDRVMADRKDQVGAVDPSCR